MKIETTISNQQILQELGIRIKDRRIEMGITQKELAEKSGVYVRTISNLENGGDVTLAVLLNVLRAEEMIDRVDELLPERVIRPSSFLNDEKVCYRVKKKKQRKDDTWHWGDEK